MPEVVEDGFRWVALCANHKWNVWKCANTALRWLTLPISYSSTEKFKIYLHPTSSWFSDRLVTSFSLVDLPHENVFLPLFLLVQKGLYVFHCYMYIFVTNFCYKSGKLICTIVRTNYGAYIFLQKFRLFSLANGAIVFIIFKGSNAQEKWCNNFSKPRERLNVFISGSGCAYQTSNAFE